MGRFTFRLPDIGEGIAEAEIVAWHVKLGDMVEEDDRIADMMTDKATVEMESPVSGKIVEVAGDAGDMIAIGSALVVIETDGGGDAIEVKPEPEIETKPTPSPETRPVDPELVEGPTFPAGAALQKKGDASTILAQTGNGGEHGSAHEAKVMASPAVRQRARELGIDLGDVRPATGDRIRHADIDAFLAYNASGGFHPAGRKGIDEQVHVIGLRRRIAENMVASKRNIPHFTYVEEYDVTALEQARAQLNEGRGERPKLSVLPLLISAICRLIPDFPMINAHFDDEAGVVTRFGAVHLGLAVQTPAGLMVPVIHDAQDRNLWQLASEISRLAQAARDGSITSAELSGSTLTITSLGALGGIASTPVINRPEVAIIGPNRIVERPAFVSDGMGGERVEKRKLMNISFSCDHRVVDGWDAASFAQKLKRLIEAPALLLAG